MALDEVASQLNSVCGCSYYVMPTATPEWDSGRRGQRTVGWAAGAPGTVLTSSLRSPWSCDLGQVSDVTGSVVTSVN